VPGQVLKGHSGEVYLVAVTADGRRAVSGSFDHTVRVWGLPPLAADAGQAGEATLYTNAKVLLVGDSGVDKSGLAYRLAEDRFLATISTDAAWATQLKIPQETGSDSIEREVWLWDFAGQADYRLVHQLYMNETALAVLVFNQQMDERHRVSPEAETPEGEANHLQGRAIQRAEFTEAAGQGVRASARDGIVITDGNSWRALFRRWFAASLSAFLTATTTLEARHPS
jgi:hypothetical protein